MVERYRPGDPMPNPEVDLARWLLAMLAIALVAAVIAGVARG